MGNSLANATHVMYDLGGGNWGGIEPAEWQLPVGNYVPTKLTMSVNAPRPDIERGINSRYSFMHSGMENAMPIVILGGSYPFRYEITSRSGTANTATATIGQTRTYSTDRSWYGSANQKDYGIFRWTPTGDDGNTYAFTVRITGQDGVFIDVPFSGVVQDSKFLFVDPVGGNDTTGTGTLALPWQTNSKWSEATSEDDTYKDNFIVWRSGLQTPMDFGVLGGTKPRVFIAFEGDTQPTYDGLLVDHHFSGDANDFFWGGIRINSMMTTNFDNRYFEIFADSDFNRATFWNSYFFDGKSGTSGSDNDAWIMSWANTGHEYLSVVSNTFDTAPLSNDGNGVDSVRLYNITYYVFEHNIIKDYIGQNTGNPKDSCYNISVRANDLWEGNSTSSGFWFGNQGGGGIHEFCWNFCNDGSAQTFRQNVGNAQYIDDFYLFRNTIVATASASAIGIGGGLTEPFPGTVESLNNISSSTDFLYSITASDGGLTGQTDDAAGNAHFANGLFANNTWYDVATQTEINMTTGKLQNAGLALLGTHGAEITL